MDTFKFFYDIYGGHRIGAIWLLNISAIRPFRVLGGFSSTPTTEVRSSIFAYKCVTHQVTGEKVPRKEQKRHRPAQSTIRIG